MHVITGLPRSGSTLLCNILNQNPNFFASSTSILPNLLGNIINIWSNSLEIKGDLVRDQIKTEARLYAAAKAFCDSWYQQYNKVVFDKSRGWSINALALRKIYPNSKILVLVRDLRNVFSSIEKQHRKNSLLDDAKTFQERTIYTRADQMFSPNGLIGSCILGIEDLIHRKVDSYFIRYEDFVKYPRKVMSEIYAYLAESEFHHDFINIENTSSELDGLYNYKFPHQGSGPVKNSQVIEWKNYISDELANTIMQRFNFYNKHFNYF